MQITVFLIIVFFYYIIIIVFFNYFITLCAISCFFNDKAEVTSFPMLQQAVYLILIKVS